jgi:Ca-activated chloride channel homolog
MSINKKIPILFLCLLLKTGWAVAQTSELVKGNEAYIKGDFDKAVEWYQKALSKDAGNNTAKYNLGVTLFRQKKYKEAAASFRDASVSEEDKGQRAQVLYNTGVALAKEDKLPEAIEAFKESLRQDPTNEDCRFNLVKAMNTLKKKQQENNKPKNEPKNQDQNQNNDQRKQPPPKSKLNRQQQQQLLQMIRKKEKDVQGRLQREKVPGIVQPEKDW